VPEYLNQLLADKATALVRENFAGVRSEWWWERRLEGGIAICQELVPASAARRISLTTGREVKEIERAIGEDLGLEDPEEPVVLTFEIFGETTVSEAARMLAERSATPEGLAANFYRRVKEAIRRS
jgi:hypothetical protein